MIRPIGWLNVWPLQSWLFRSRSGLVGVGTRTMLVQEGGVIESEIKDKAPNLTVLLLQAQRSFGLDIARAEIEQLDPRHAQPWEVSTTNLMIHVAIVTNPNAWLYSGGAQFSPIPGAVVAIDTNVLHSAVNFGDTPRIHLVLRLGKATQSEE